MPPAPPVSDDAVPTPVFVDDTGRRHRAVRVLGWFLGVVMVAYLALLGVSLVGSPGLVPLSLPALGRILPGPAAAAIEPAAAGHTSHDPAAGLPTPAISRLPATTTGRAVTTTDAATPRPTLTTRPRPAATPQPTAAATSTPAATHPPSANPSPHGTARPTQRPSTHPSPHNTKAAAATGATTATPAPTAP